MSRHTSEPWRVIFARSGYLIDSTDGARVVRGAGGFASKDDAERAVACVNACAGIPAEALLGDNLLAPAQAALAVLGQLDYLQNLWGKEGVTHSLAERLRGALKPFAQPKEPT